MATPGAADTKEEAKAYKTSPELSKSDATAFRSLAARLNFLAIDRTDLQFAAKEIAKRMAGPKEANWRRLKEVARYLLGAPRLVQLFEWRALTAQLHTYTDSNWAGDQETRKSTSGSAVTWGQHTLRRGPAPRM